MDRFRYNSCMESEKSDPSEAEESRSRHLLPYIAIASSLVLCCPMTSLMGFVLGLISLRRIQASHGRLGGRTIAKMAMALGLIMVPVQYFILDAFQKMNERLLQEGLEHSMSVVFDVDSQDRSDDLLRVFSSLDGKRPSTAEIDSFVERATSELGPYQGLSVIRSTPGESGFLDRSYEIAVGFRFTARTVTGGVECLVIPSGTSLPHSILFQRIELQVLPESALMLPASTPGSTKNGDPPDGDPDGQAPDQSQATGSEQS